MKALSELGISPWPLRYRDASVVAYRPDGGLRDDVQVAPSIICKDSALSVVDVVYEKKDARLIAAAPELYEALREAVDAFVCKGGESFDDGCEGCIDIYGCNVRKWRFALAKASGEEAK